MERLIHLLVYAGVATALFSTLGVLVMSGVNRKLHYLAPASTIGISLIALAIILSEGASQATTKTALCAVVIILTNPTLTHATARAARNREWGRWFAEIPGEHKRVE